MAVKIPILILDFVYFANFLLSLLQLQVVINTQTFIDGFSSFQIVLARLRSFQIVLGLFSLFLLLVSTVRSYFSYKLRLSHELRDTNLSFLSKDKKDIKKFVLQFALKFLINLVLTRKQGGCAYHFVENFSKNE